VTVQFQSASEVSSFVVSVGEGEGAQECRTPCTLQLHTGDTTLRATETLSGRTRAREFYVGAPMTVSFDRRFPTAWMAWGVAAATVGVGLTIAGAWVEAERAQLGGDDRRVPVSLLLPGSVLAAGGAGLLLSAMLRSGIESRREPLRSAASSPRLTEIAALPAGRGAWAGISVTF